MATRIQKAAQIITDLNAELAVWRRMFGAAIEQHEWWQPGPRMGDPESRYLLPDGHEVLKEEWQREESRATCRKCRFERELAAENGP